MFGEKNYLGLLVPRNTLDDETAGNIQNLVKKLSSALEKCKKEKNIRFGWLNQIHQSMSCQLIQKCDVCLHSGDEAL